MNSRFVELQKIDPHADLEAFASSVMNGLTARHKSLSSRFFYDATGSSLFNAICRLPEYYLTRAERLILERHGGDILKLIDRSSNELKAYGSTINCDAIDLIELGAGSSGKTEVFVRTLLTERRAFTYIPIDICLEAMVELDQSMINNFGHTAFEMRGVVAEYNTGLDWLDRQESRRRTVMLFFGSNIGNLTRQQAVDFLRRIQSSMKFGDIMIIGIDKKPHASKDVSVVKAAYNDAAGVTAAFNYNLLRRINREFGATFDVAGFNHTPYYDPIRGGMISRLTSTKNQDVYIDSLKINVHFDQGEPIETEMSLKYDRKDVEALADASYFEVIGEFSDPEDLFGIYVLRA